MKDSVLNNIKLEYLKRKEEKAKLEKYRDELLELIQDENVREYLSVLNKVNRITNDINYHISLLDDSEILNNVMDEELDRHSNTNKIMACLGTYIRREDSDIRVPDNGSGFSDSYKIYADLEKGIGSLVRVPLVLAKMYEKLHDVIHLDSSFPISTFKRVRSDFVEEAMKTTQSDAKEKILKKYSR